MTISPTPAELMALRVANAAVQNSKSPNSHIIDTAIFALGSACLLQSPESAAELVALRARVAELEALVCTAGSRDEQAHLMDPLDHVLEHLADTVEPSPMAVLVARQNEAAL